MGVPRAGRAFPAPSSPAAARWRALTAAQGWPPVHGRDIPRDDASAVQPLIPTWRKEPFDELDWLFEFKYGGLPGPPLCYLERGRGRFLSRNGNVLGRLGALCNQMAGRD
jgi:hypothetical protein